MLDIKFIRENPDKVKEACQKKQVKCDIDRVLELDEQRRKFIQGIEVLKSDKNKLGKDNVEQAKKIKKEIKKLEPELDKVEKEFEELMKQIPNPPLDEVPVGKDESENKVLRQEGKKPKFDFPIKDYLAIAEKLDIIDIKRAAKVSGSRFGYLKGEAVLLEFSLVQLAFEVLIK